MEINKTVIKSDILLFIPLFECHQTTNLILVGTDKKLDILLFLSKKICATDFCWFRWNDLSLPLKFDKIYLQKKYNSTIEPKKEQLSASVPMVKCQRYYYMSKHHSVSVLSLWRWLFRCATSFLSIFPFLIDCAVLCQNSFFFLQ